MSKIKRLKLLKVGGVARIEIRKDKETYNFKNKVMVQESQYTFDGSFRGI